MAQLFGTFIFVMLFLALVLGILIIAANTGNPDAIQLVNWLKSIL